MVGIEGTTGRVTADTHRAGVTEDNKLVVLADISGAAVFDEALVITDLPNYRIHEGLAYEAGSYRIGIPLDGSGGMLINVGSLNLHTMFESITDGDAILEFFENVAVSNSGTSLPIYNRRRDCGSTVNSTLWDNPTVTASGAMIYSALFLGGSGTANKFQSETVNIAAGKDDTLLSNGSSYWIKITNQCGRDMNLDYNFIMHEH